VHTGDIPLLPGSRASRRYNPKGIITARYSNMRAVSIGAVDRGGDDGGTAVSCHKV
jgi:hypothetical protein